MTDAGSDDQHRGPSSPVIRPDIPADVDPTLPRPGPGVERPAVVLPGDVVAIGRKDLLADARLDELLDPKTLTAVIGRLRPLIETEPVDPGATLMPRVVAPDALTTIARSAAAVAAGVTRPAAKDEPLTVVWEDGDAELIVHLDDVDTELGDGFVDVVIPVECDQVDRSDIVVTIVTAHPDQPFGSVFATGHRPHGPRAVVDRWSESLIAYAWQIVDESAKLVAASAGRDRDNRALGASSVVASRDGLTVVPLGEHRFPDASVLGTKR